MSIDEDRIISEVVGDKSIDTERDNDEEHQLRQEYQATMAWLSQRPQPSAPPLPAVTMAQKPARKPTLFLWWAPVAAAALLLLTVLFNRSNQAAVDPVELAAPDWTAFERLDRGTSSLTPPTTTPSDPLEALRRRASKPLEL